MSYDLDVYGKISLTTRELAKEVLAVSGLRTRRTRRLGPSVLTVRTDADDLCFTVEGPFRVDPEDIEQELSDIAGFTVLYSIHVPYDVGAGRSGFRLATDNLQVAAAADFASRLAARVNGTVVDRQAIDQVATTSEPEPESAAPTLYLHLEWYRALDDIEAVKDSAVAYLRTARDIFPLAVPTRFGPYEPMQGRLPRDGDAAFGEMYQRECERNDLTMSGKSFVWGNVSAWADDTHTRFQDISVVFELASLESAAALGKVQEFVVELARRSGSFFAFAEVNDTRYTTARPLGFNGAWGGLPKDPQWITWYGSEYAKLVRPYLTAGVTEDYPEGTAHRWTEHPTQAAEIMPLLGRDSWVPAELRGELEENGASAPRGRRPAEVMPPALRPPEPGSPLALRIEARYARARSRESRA